MTQEEKHLGVLVDHKMTMSHQNDEAGGKANMIFAYVTYFQKGEEKSNTII